MKPNFKSLVLLFLCFFSACQKGENYLTIDSPEPELFSYYKIFRLSDFDVSPFSVTSQGMDIYDDKVLFQAGNNGNVIHVLDLNTIKPFGTIHLQTPYKEPSHMNNINCGSKYSESDLFPVLYVSQTSNSHYCFVIRLQNDARSYTMVQTIRYCGTLHHINSEYDWFIDLKGGYIYTYGKHDGRVEEREIVKFPLPSLEYDSVVFTDEDVIDSFIISNMSIYQGSRIIGGLLYAPVGYGDAAYPGYLLIIDLEEKKVIHSISLDCGEPESIGAYKNGGIICGGGKNPAFYFIHL